MVVNSVKEYAFIIAIDHNYILPVQALINSIIAFKMHNYSDVILLYKNIDPSIFFTDSFKPICIKSDNIPVNRYLDLPKFGNKYKSVCILDGDMLFLSDVKRFFEISSLGFPVGCNDDTSFDRKDVKGNNGDTVIDIIKFYGVLCNSPFFFNYEHTKPLWETFYKLYEKCSKTCDYELFNFSLSLNPLIVDKLITYPSCCFTGVHHTHLKMQTMFQFDFFSEEMVENLGNDAVFKNNFIITRDWMRVYSFHGKFFDKGWIDDCTKQMIKYYLDEYDLKKNKIDFFAENCERAMERLTKIFAHHVFQGEIKIEVIEKFLISSHKEMLLFLKKHL